MDRKEQKDALLPSFFTISRQRKWAGACGGAAMWFQCPRPHGIIPSGGKPLRLFWPITPPIINSRSALSFLLHLSSFLLPAYHSFSFLPLAPSPALTFSTFFLIFHLYSHLFLLSFPFCLTHCVVLQWLTPSLIKEMFALVTLTQIWPGHVKRMETCAGEIRSEMFWRFTSSQTWTTLLQHWDQAS